MDKTLTVEQAADYLGVCKRTVYRLCKQGDLPYIRVLTKIIRIRPEDLEAYIAARRK